MEKLTLTISPEDWGNLVTKYNADSRKVKLSDFTDGTVNIDTDITGSITKCKGSINYNAALLAAATKDQFEAIFSDGARHLLVVQSGEIKYSSGDTIFNTVVNGTGFSTGANFEFATTQDRVYGGNATDDPIVYDRSTSYGGVAYTAPRVRDMGVQAPSAAPTAGAPTAGGAVPNGAHTYKITFLYYDFEESNGSPASGAQTAGAGNNTIPLTAIPIGGYGVTARKVYRDNNDGLYLHVGTVANNTATTFSDTLAVGVTPTEIPLFNNAPPSFGLVTLWVDKLWVSKVPGDPYSLFYSETGIPDVFRPENQILCNQEDPVTAHVVYFDRLVVFNRRSMGQILGKTSDTFRYAAIPSSIGCVDNRTLQTRVVEGVPVLIWLSDRGFYSYDGNAINYISDPIEDLVNFNIQQAVQQKNSNTQTSQSHFSGGTASQGIDILSAPGSITTKGYADGTSVAGTNPRRNFDDQSDWDSGSTKTGISTKDGTNTLKAIKAFNPVPASGSFTGLVEGQGANRFHLPFITPFTGETANQTSSHVNEPSGGGDSAIGTALKIVVPRGGNFSAFNFSAIFSGTPALFSVRIWNDASGLPGSVVYQSGVLNATSFAIITTSGGLVRRSVTHSFTQTVAAGTYWIGILRESGGQGIYRVGIPQGTSGNPWLTSARAFFGVTTGAWHITTLGQNIGGSLSTQTYSFCRAPVPASGQWQSSVYDTFSADVAGITIEGVSETPSGSDCAGAYTSSASVTVQGSNDPLFLGGPESSVIVPLGTGGFTTNVVTLNNQKRYWRLVVAISRTNDAETEFFSTKFNYPFVEDLHLHFQAPVGGQAPAVWTSPTIDATADVVSHDSLNVVSTIPGGTSLAIAVATSHDDISYPDGFVPFGTQTLRRYIKIRLHLTSDNSSSNQLTPEVSSVILRWTLTANFISSGIDTGLTPPAGWDAFLTADENNGGTLAYQMRSATTLGGLTSATFFTVTPGTLPSSVTPLQFVQWKVIITSSDNDVPQVDSVTVQWLISQISSIRPASIFVEGRYYVALAESEQTTNNILLYLDLKGKWRRRSDLAIATFSYFFNRPYFGLSSSGRIRKFLEGDSNAGTPIILDVRTKAADYSTQYQDHSSKVKVVGEVILRGINTGATIQLMYSIDEGQTFTTMLTSSGASSYVTATDGRNFYVRFRPTWDGATPIAGRTIMYRILSSDVNMVEILGIEAVAFLRNQAPVITG